jgi:hypothetical protein
MCGGVDPRPLLRTWAGVAICLFMLWWAWELSR